MTQTNLDLPEGNSRSDVANECQLSFPGYKEVPGGAIVSLPTEL